MPAMDPGPKSLAICLGILVAASLFPAALAAQAPASKYPGQPFVIEQKFTKVSYRNNGTGRMSVQASIRVQTPTGVQQLGLLSFYYAAANETAQVALVRVKRPDGTVVTSGAVDIHDVPAPLTTAAPLFSDLRMKQVTVRGLTPGALLQYKVLFHIRKALVPGQFWFQYDFVHKAVSLDEQLQVSVPKGRKLIVKSEGLQPSITTAAGRRTYLWKSANLKIRKRAKGRLLPPFSVELTTFPTWAALGHWWASLADPMAVPDAAIKTEAAKLIRGATTRQQKLRAIYDYVSTQFRYIGVSFGIGRYKPHAADDVFQNGFGDCKDKDTLLVALLAAVHIPAYPALVNISRKINPAVPSPGQFDHVITVVPQNGKLIWLDTTAGVAPFGLLVGSLRNRSALVMPPGKPATLVRTPAEPPFRSLETFRIDGTLDSQGTLQAKFRVTLRGDREILYRDAFLALSPQQQLRFVQSVSRFLGYGGTVSNVVSSPPDDLNKPFSFTYDYTRKNYSDWSQKQITPPLPPFLLPTPQKSTAGKTPGLPLGAPGMIDFRAKVQLPKGYQPKLPKPVLLKDGFATYQASYSFKDGTLLANRELQTFKGKLPAAGFTAYGKLKSAIEADENTYISLTTASAKNQTQAQALFQKGVDALEAHDPYHAKSLFERVLKLSPHYPRAWIGIAEADARTGQADDALTAIEKEISAHPNEAGAYEYAGNVESMLRDFDKALVDYKKGAQLAPNDAHAQTMLGALLAVKGHYNQAVAPLSRAATLDPQDTGIRTELAAIYLQIGNPAKALGQFTQAAKADPRPAMWGYIASSLAGADKELGPAAHYAQLAVTGEEKNTAGLNLDTLSLSNLQAMTKLARYWDMLGWIDYLQGNYGPAEKYLRASWTLAYLPLAGYHLGRLYQHLGKKQAAINTYAMARANEESQPEVFNRSPVPGMGYSPWVLWIRDAGLKENLKMRLRNLLGDANRASAAVTAGGTRLSQLRTVKLPLLLDKVTTASFYVLLTPKAQVSAVKYAGGNAALRSAGEALAAAKFPVLFPDSGPTRIIRKVLVSCDPAMHACDAVLYPPDAINSVN